MIKIIVSQSTSTLPPENNFEDQDDDLSFLADEFPKKEQSEAPEPNDVQLVDDELDVSPYPDSADSSEELSQPQSSPQEQFQIPPVQPNIPEQPIPPEENFEELKPLEEPEQSEQAEKEKTLDLRGQIWKAMSENLPLRIVYTSLKGLTTERTVFPDYIYWAGTHRHVMVSWDSSKNDWRAFIVDRIRKAKIEEKEQENPQVEF